MLTPVEQRIEAHDPSLFERVYSQTSRPERISLLALQAAIRARHSPYAYLEIGSYLGGSIQPYLVDPRCSRIFSIDARPSESVDERSPGCVVKYEQNSEAHMLELLAAIDTAATVKIRCFNRDAAQIEANCIDPKPAIAFIDGQHTRQAVLSDFAFCRRILRADGVIAFHDAEVIHSALQKILHDLRAARISHVWMKLGGSVFAISFDMDLLKRHRRLAVIAQENRKPYLAFAARQHLKHWLPSPVMAVLRKLRNSVSHEASSA